MTICNAYVSYRLHFLLHCLQVPFPPHVSFYRDENRPSTETLAAPLAYVRFPPMAPPIEGSLDTTDIPLESLGYALC